MIISNKRNRCLYQSIYRISGYANINCSLFNKAFESHISTFEFYGLSVLFIRAFTAHLRIALLIRRQSPFSVPIVVLSQSVFADDSDQNTFRLEEFAVMTDVLIRFSHRPGIWHC